MVYRFCVVKGCRSEYYPGCGISFHGTPKDVELRKKWDDMVPGDLYSNSIICTMHFEPEDYSGAQNKLKPGVIPTIFTKSLKEQPNPNLSECSDEAAPRGELVACRVCLAADGRLYAIRGSGLEDSLAALTGVALSAEESMPRHLCVFCLAKLSKFAAFRDSCQRSTALLQTLRAMGRLKMDAIRAYNQMSRQLKTNLTVSKVFEFGTVPLLEITPLVKTEEDPNLCEEEFTEVENFESEVLTKQDDDDGDGFMYTFEPLVQLREISEPKWSTNNPQCTKDEMETESPGTLSELDDCADAVEKNGAALKTEYDLAFEKEYHYDITVLSKEEQKQKIEERKRRNSSAHSCGVCGRRYNTEGTLTRHKTYYHDPSSPFECDVCRCRFRHRHDLTKHREIHRAVLKCRQCGLVCFSRSRAKQHYFTHKGSKYKCPHCDMVYDRPCSYYGHVRLEHPDKNEACDECGETFIGEMGLMVHKQFRHRTNDKPRLNLKCTDCQVTFLSAEALQRHEELSAGAAHALWPCAACGESCASDAAETHPPGQLHCQECDKTFSDSASFALHAKRKHQRPPKARGRRRALGSRSQGAPAAPSGPFVCDMCGKVLSCLAKLEYHMNRHLGVKPFQCPHCPKAFADQAQHMIHMRTHTGERPYQCERCPRKFTSRGNFQRHVKCVHLRMQATCDKCGKTMKAASLAAHVRAVHMNIPYVRRKRDRTKKKLRLVTES